MFVIFIFFSLYCILNIVGSGAPEPSVTLTLLLLDFELSAYPAMLHSGGTAVNTGTTISVVDDAVKSEESCDCGPYHEQRRVDEQPVKYLLSLLFCRVIGRRIVRKGSRTYR